MSSAFTIPEEAQSLTWWYKTAKWGGTNYYLLDAETNDILETMYENAGTNGAWRQLSYNISPYIGKEVKLRLLPQKA